MKTEQKKTYLPPIMTVEIISMEEGIAAGSAVVKPGSSEGASIKQEWETGDDVNVDFEW